MKLLKNLLVNFKLNLDLGSAWRRIFKRTISGRFWSSIFLWSKNWFFNVSQFILSGSRSFWNLGFPRRDLTLPRRDLVRDRDENEIFKDMKKHTKTMSRPINQRLKIQKALNLRIPFKWKSLHTAKLSKRVYSQILKAPVIVTSLDF